MKDVEVIEYEKEERGEADILKIFFKEVSEIPLLTAEQEKELSETIMRANRRIEESKENGGEDKEAERELAKAVYTLVNHNIRLVARVVKKYLGIAGNFDWLDLIQEGSIGLYEAARRFNYTKSRFYTYASWWINGEIKKAIPDRSGNIHIPIRVWEDILRIKSGFVQFTTKHHCFPTIDELAEYVGISLEKVERALGAFSVMNYLSLHIPVNDGEDDEFGDFIKNEKSSDSFEEIEKNDLKKVLKEALEKLDDRKREILILRFGLSGEEPLTLEEVGNRIGLSKERVRQIQNEALKKLRFSKRLRMLEPFRDNGGGN